MKVSILIPCYNARPWIGQAIESALAQTWAEREIIVVDDGSTDGSGEVVARFGGRLCFIRTEHRGGNAARNLLLANSSGAWLQYLDADDWLRPEKIASQAAFIANHPDCDVVYGPVTIQYSAESNTYNEEQPIPGPHDDPFELLALWRLPQTGAALFRRDAVVDVGGWKEGQTCCQEHELYLRMLIAGKRFVYGGSGGAVYRRWSDATVSRRDMQDVHRQRIAIEDRLEAHLVATGRLTARRMTAVNQARFETARMAWLYSHETAVQIVASLIAMQPAFVPSGPAAPRLYALIFRLFGFRCAETVAGLRRRILGSLVGAGRA